jgi:transposase
MNCNKCRWIQLQNQVGGIRVISIGIDISKETSTVCILKPYGEILCKPYQLNHKESELQAFSAMVLNYEDEVRIVMEATGAYHLPVLSYLKEQGLFVTVINPLVMKKYVSMTLRKGKTDKLDALKIANYGIDNWFRLTDHNLTNELYDELRLLGRQYTHYIGMRVQSKLALTNLLDRTMPRIKTLLKNNSETPDRDKLNDFVEEYWHYDNITKMKEDKFVKSYVKWTKTKGYHQSETKAKKIYAIANEGIPTLSSSTPSTKMLVQEAVRVLREIDKTLRIILSQMQELARGVKEYEVVRAMAGVGDTLAPRLIAEIGDIRRFHSSKALIAYAGIDAPAYESGQFIGTKRRISKRGSSLLRKTGYEVMKCIKTHKPSEDAVYLYMIKKELEGKALKVAKIAALNKFLRIYYARAKEVYQ